MQHCCVSSKRRRRCCCHYYVYCMSHRTISNAQSLGPSNKAGGFAYGTRPSVERPRRGITGDYRSIGPPDESHITTQRTIGRSVP